MKIIKTRVALQKVIHDLQQKQQSIGLIPTMGYLHQGHASLITRAGLENDQVIVSVFVNPKQFGPQEDFKNYPRNFKHDQEMLEQYKVDYLFCPLEGEMYQANEAISFSISNITDCLCGLSRPDHFQGVCLVLVKLFHLIQPKRVYFGQKDYQQTVVVRHLLENLFFDIQMIVCPTVREKDGLAMSSRNIHLSSLEREKAPYLYQSLLYGLDFIYAGEKNPVFIIQKISDFLLQRNITDIDYIDIRDGYSLEKVKIISDRQVVIALAVFFEKARLIDNILSTSHVPQK